jgi:protein O-mannosyl-transferase
MKWQNQRPPNEQAEPPALSHAWLFGLFLVAITLIAYGPAWHAGFIWDDDTFLTLNPVIKSADGLYRLWFTASTPDYYPVTSSMLWLEWRIWANHPLGYHLVNVLLHAFSAVLLWRVLQRLNIPGALLAAAIFALHPVNVESVAWITERKNTLSMFFYAGTLLCWLKFEDSGRWRWYGLALAGFALALLSKTAVAPLPVVLLGMAWWRRGRVGWKDVRQVVPFFVIAAALGLVTVWFQSHRAIGHEVVRTDGFWSRLAGAGWAVWFYLYKALLPLKLAFVYPRWQIDARNVVSYIPLVLLAAVFVLCWRSGREWGKALFFGLAYFVVMLLPILGFLNIYYMRYSLVADYWQYFAIIGPITLVAAIIRKPVLAAVLLLALGALTWKQCGMYVDADTLWLQTLRQNPDCWIAHDNLGAALMNKEGQVDEAFAHFQKAFKINPDNAETHNNLGIVFDQKGRVDEAIAQYQEALQIKPDFTEAHFNLGIALLQKGRVDEAIFQYQKALQTSPDYAAARLNLGNALLRKGSVDDAIAQYRQALQIKPDLEEAHYNLGNALLQKGSMDEAISQYQQALQIKPADAEARNNLGTALLQKGSADEAISQYQAALQINPGYAEAHRNLGLALARKGRPDEAIAHFQQALKIRPGFAGVRINLGNVLLQQGRLDEAIRQYQEALQSDPDNGDTQNNLGNLFLQKGKEDEAMAHFQRALQLEPANASVQNNLAWLLATGAEASLRNGDKAVELARQANALTGGENPIILHTLAAAFAETGRFAEAVETAQHALDLAGAQSNTRLAGQLQVEMKLYQAGTPFHAQ